MQLKQNIFPTDTQLSNELETSCGKKKKCCKKYKRKGKACGSCPKF